MRTAANRRQLTLWLAAIAGVALVGLLSFTNVCNLDAVTLNGVPVVEWQEAYGLTPDRHILDQPVESLAARLLEEPKVFKVDINFHIPDRIDIRTNDFEIGCFVVDAASGQMRGLNSEGRVIPIRSDMQDWEHPIITGVSAAELYSHCSDLRVGPIVEQLTILRRDYLDLYRLISEINLTERYGVTVVLAGVPYKLIVSPDHLVVQISEFIQFLEQFGAPVEDATVIDLRYDNMIVKRGSKS